MKLMVSGHYVFTRNKHDEPEKVITEFENLITDVGLNSLLTVGSLNSICARCCLGTSIASPTVSDLLLGNEVVNAAYQTVSMAQNQVTDAPAVWREFTHKYTFNPGTIPSIVSEVGVKDNTAALKSGKLFSRTLIKDEHGNPTTITVLPDEYLNIYYTVRINYPNSGQLAVANIELDGVNHAVSSTFFNLRKTLPGFRILSVLPYDGLYLTVNSSAAVLTDIEASVSLPTSSRLVLLNQNTTSHNALFSFSNNGITTDADSVSQSATITLTPNAGNLIDIAYLAGKHYYDGDFPGFQFTIDPPITKTESQSLSFDIELTYSRG